MPRKFKALATIDTGFIEGGSGNDTLTGTVGRDIYALRDGGGHDVVTDFNLAKGDHVMLDFGSYSDILFLGAVTDGLVVHGFTGTDYTFTVQDLNGDGALDTMVQVGDDSITLLGVSGLHGCDFMGG